MIVKTPFGSHLYGLDTPTSDHDYKGIFMPEVRDILLGRIPRTQKLSSGPSHVRNSQGDVDSETYSLHHFVQLALQGQTVALDMLHGNLEEEATPAWYFMKKHRSRFYTRSMKAFVGYARKQAAKYGIKGSRLDAVREALAFLMTKGDRTIQDLYEQGELWEGEHIHLSLYTLPDGDYEITKSYWEVCGKKMTFGGKASYYVPMLKKFYEQYGHRAKLAEQNQGVDWKAMSHALRVGYQTEAIFKHKTFSYPLEQTPYLLQVKLGNLPYKEVAYVLDKLMVDLEVLASQSSLPLVPDVKFWDTWVAQQTLDHIKGEQNLVTDPMLHF
jgi:hypothetical protein